ncbi:YceD family protein [Paenibacillus sp. DYY-L-2]|uniref:YceD family protein n=1 Tax=Paenibacillus sp. DYY-L-2 TaxID=3447013 RepID=UPI003F4F5B23
MIIHFRQLASTDRPVEFHQVLDVSRVVKGRKDISGAGPLQVDLQAESESGGVVKVTGRLAGELDMSCSRCLKPLVHKVDIEFEESFKQSDHPEAEAQGEDEDVQWVAEDQVDLVPFVEEAFLLNLPYAALCKEDCKGLCPSCGTDRNERDCGCNTERIDPRLASLSDFFKKD